MNLNIKKEIIRETKKRTAKPAFALEIQKDRQPGLLDNKFGGVPYWDLDLEYPADAKGNKLLFIAQINLAQVPSESELPRQGLLQFFTGLDDVFGLDFDDQDRQDTFRVVYHAKTDGAVTKEQVLSLDVPVSSDSNYQDFTPIFKESAVEIAARDICMGDDDYRFELLFKEIAKERYGEDLGEDSLYDIIGGDDYEQLEAELSSENGHWMLGYPFFTQCDPRGEEQRYERYDTLLLQIDSDMIGGEDYVLWGDCGVGNFFINREDLKNMDFSRVLYNWDCC